MELKSGMKVGDCGRIYEKDIEVIKLNDLEDTYDYYLLVVDGVRVKRFWGPNSFYFLIYWAEKNLREVNWIIPRTLENWKAYLEAIVDATFVYDID